jgi:hypothetical protein
MVIAIDEFCVGISNSKGDRWYPTPNYQSVPLATGIYVLEATNLHDVTISFEPSGGFVDQELDPFSAPQTCLPECCFVVPKNYSYYMDPLKLVDDSKTGRLRVLTIHLMDPNMPRLSSTEIPMQQPSWIHEATVAPLARAKGLPWDVQLRIQDLVGGGLTGEPIKGALRSYGEDRFGAFLFRQAQ